MTTDAELDRILEQMMPGNPPTCPECSSPDVYRRSDGTRLKRATCRWWQCESCGAKSDAEEIER